MKPRCRPILPRVSFSAETSQRLGVSVDRRFRYSVERLLIILVCGKRERERRRERERGREGERERGSGEREKKSSPTVGHKPLK